MKRVKCDKMKCIFNNDDTGSIPCEKFDEIRDIINKNTEDIKHILSQISSIEKILNSNQKLAGDIKYVMRRESDKICVYKQFIHNDEVIAEKKCEREYYY